MAWLEDGIDQWQRAFAEGDVEAARELVHEDVVFDWSRSRNDVRGIYRGMDGLRTLFHRFFEAWEDVTWQVTGTEELPGDRMLITTQVRARGQSSGIEIDARGAQIWEHRDHRFTRVTMYQDREQALAEEAGR